MQNFFKYNKGELYYEVYGEKNLEVLVFIHGFSLNNRMWKHQIRYFSKHYKVVVYDMRGFGKSSLPNGNYSHHDDLRALLSYLNVKKCSIIGLSLGGEIAIDFALEFPSLVNNLILLNSSLAGYKSTVDWDVKAKELGVEQAKRNWLNHFIFESIKENKIVLHELETILNDYSGWHWMNKDTRIKINPPTIKQLAKITMPTLIIKGQKDLQYYHDISDILHKSIINSSLAEVESGHMANMEKPKEVNQIIAGFIGSTN